MTLFKKKRDNLQQNEFSEGVYIFRLNEDDQDPVADAYNSAQRFTLNGIVHEEIENS